MAYPSKPSATVRSALSAPEALVDAALDDAELRLVERASMRRVSHRAVLEGDPGPRGPVGGAVDRVADDLDRGGKRRADVEHHLDVGAQRPLQHAPPAPG